MKILIYRKLNYSDCSERNVDANGNDLFSGDKEECFILKIDEINKSKFPLFPQRTSTHILEQIATAWMNL